MLRIVPMALLILLVVFGTGAAAVLLMDLQSGGRAFIAGESLWSRAQQDVVFHLDRYAERGRATDLASAREALVIPLSVREARIALEGNPPDLDRARAGFIDGGNHPDDVPRLIRLYQLLGDTPELQRALSIWAESDIWVLRLQVLADELESLWADPDPSTTMRESVRNELSLIDRTLNGHASAFSTAIGEANRRFADLTRVVSLLAILLVVVVLLVAVLGVLRGLKRSEMRFWNTFEQAPVAMALIQGSTTMLEINDAMCRLLQRSAQQTRAQPLSHFSHPDDRSALRKFVSDGANGETPSGDFESRYQRPDGSTVWGKLSLAPLQTSRSGQAELQVAVLEDISEPHRLAGELAYQAAHDQLTGLPNRRDFERHLNKLIHAVAQGNGRHALCLIDLDQFKLVNDSFGHLAGDALLVRLTEKMQECLREDDLLARLDGDEFGLLLMDCPTETAIEVAERIRATITEFEFRWDERPISISASIGLVPIHAENHDAPMLLQQSNIACHEAKEQGRNRIQVHSELRSSSLRRQEEMGWVHRINQALTQGQLRFHGQWIKPMHGAGMRCELLLRLKDPDGELHTASDFMEAAERFHIARTVDRWVVENALLRIREFERRDSRVEAWHINLSGQSVDCEKMLPELIDRIRDSGVPPGKLCFEITESAAIHSIEEAREFFEALRDLGCQIALDDFGKGLSTFDYLKQLPVDLVKIDGGFVRELAHSELDHAMVRSVHEIARIAGLRTIAESVESVEVWMRLKQIGIDYLQGHAIHNPVRLDDLVLPDETDSAVPADH